MIPSGMYPARTRPPGYFHRDIWVFSDDSPQDMYRIEFIYTVARRLSRATTGSIWFLLSVNNKHHVRDRSERAETALFFRK